MINILRQVENFASTLLRNSEDINLYFHNLNHTRDVVNAVKEISSFSSITENELYIVIVAAWFHDCGYINSYTMHEEESCKIAAIFLAELDCEKEFIVQVSKCINSTKYSEVPSTLLEKIICDADMYHLCKTNYPTYETLLRRELEINLDLFLSDEEWQRQNCDFFINHQYYTKYGQMILSKFKEINMQFVRKKHKEK